MPARDRVRGRVVAKAVAVLALLAFLAFLTPFVPRILRACGPYFPLEILSTRDGAALEPPPAMPVTDGLAPTPGENLPVDEGDNETSRTRAEHSELSPEQTERLKAMRALSDGDAAYAAGEGLPRMVRDYTAGAVGYHGRQFDKAREYFTSVLPLEPDKAKREPRVVWARFMLGKIAALQGDVEGASAHWAAVRGLVRSGMTDPLGLAVASLGEEARLWLRPGTLAKAVSLYAKQAAYGSERGRASLLMVAEQAIRDPALLDEGLRDVTTRRLILRYLYSAGDPAADADADPGAAPDADPGDDSDADRYADPDADLRSLKTFDRILAAFERQRVSQVEGADLLAAQAYATGRFELAARLAVYESTSLSAWITGKLALRRGDRHAALRSFADAVRGLPANHADRARIQAESGVLRLSAGDFAQAMEVFYGAAVDSWHGRQWTNYWADLAYLAERVLTLDELLPLVDRLAPTRSRAELEAAARRDGELPAGALRELTARRLMRAGRYEEALRYFDADERLQGIAKKYVDAVTAGRNGWRTQEMRAEAWFAAAAIARADGMELLGFELAPDDAMYDGNIQPPGGALASITAAPANPPANSPTDPRTDLPAASGAPTPAERQRVEASKPAIDSRFHYRLTAVDHALASADFLPRSSQAFAAVLCRATSWIIDREPERAAKVYARYVNEGPYVPWAVHFGRKCPDPDFPAAERRRWKERFAAATWFYTRHPRRTTATAALIAVAGIAWLAWRNRKPRIEPAASGSLQ